MPAAMELLGFVLSVFACTCAVSAQVAVTPSKYAFDLCCDELYGTGLFNYGLTSSKEECAVLCEGTAGCVSLLYNPRNSRCYTNSAQFPARTTTTCTAASLIYYGEITTLDPYRPAPLPLTYCVDACTNTVNNYRLCDGGGPGQCHPKQGRLEFLNGAWGTVCDDWWETSAPNLQANVNVSCSVFGYKKGGVARRLAFYGQGVGDIWLDDVQCDGTEVAPDACYHMGLGNNNCAHSEDVGVQCY